MKVLFVLHQVQAGGAEAMARDLARGLRGAGVDSRLAAIHASRGDVGEDGGVPVHVLGGPPTMAHAPLALLRLLVLCWRQSPDLVHSHGEVPDLLCRLVCGVLRIPLVVTAHTVNPWHWRRRLGLFLERSGVRRTRRYTAVSESIAAMLRRDIGVPPEQVEVIANWAPMMAVEPGPIPTMGRPTVIHVARLHVQKGQDILLQAFAQVRREFRDAVLWMVGAGPEEARLRGMAGEGVIFLGWRDDVPALLKRADLFVLSSHWEGMPLTMLEAMTESVPVVATAVDGIPEIIQDGVCGLLVPPGEAGALADAMLSCLRDPDRARRMGIQGANRCASLREQGLRAYLDLYHRVLAG